jgi:hypothetical protein
MLIVYGEPHNYRTLERSRWNVHRLSWQTIKDRIDKGWSPEKALTEARLKEPTRTKRVAS